MDKTEQNLKIIIIGETGVGKTAILQKYINSKLEISKPTLSAYLLKKEVTIDNQ